MLRAPSTIAFYLLLGHQLLGRRAQADVRLIIIIAITATIMDHHGSSFVIIHHQCYHRPRWFVLSSGRMAPSWSTQPEADNTCFSYHDNCQMISFDDNTVSPKIQSAQQLMLQKLVLSSSLLWTGMLIAGQSYTITSTILEDKPTHHDCHP